MPSGKRILHTRLSGQIQKGVRSIGIGISAVIWEVDDSIVLKAPIILEQPTKATPVDIYLYDIDAIFRYDCIENERTIFRLLQQQPHANIVQAIAIEHPEGIYLERHRPLSHCHIPSQLGRILWYQDMLRALLHIHQLKIAHSDVRIENFLCDSQDRIKLCDFGCSRPFGEENPSATRPDEPLKVNGLAQTVSDSTDRFALASVIFQLELGYEPELSVVDGALLLPEFSTRNDGIDSMITSAWLGKYSSTAQMLEHAESIHKADDIIAATSSEHRQHLRCYVNQWRSSRQERYGNALR